MKLDRKVGDLTCAQVLAQLSAYLDGELDETEVAKIRAHVAGCANCERFGGRFGAAVQGLRALPSLPLDGYALDALCRRVEAS
jgi:anti-sigma factor RsiW